MKNKKGFTLVELVAVIALLAVILLLVIPNVVSIFNRGKKAAFASLVQDVYRQAEKDYSVTHTLDRYNPMFCDMETYYDLNEEYDCNRLSFNEDTARYFVQLDNEGKITRLIVGNDEFCYSGYPTVNIDEHDISDGYYYTVEDGEVFCSDNPGNR